MRKLSALLTISLLLILGYWMTRPQVSDSSDNENIQETEVIGTDAASEKKPSLSQVPDKSKILDEAKNCLGLDMTLESGESLNDFLARKTSQEDWHWDNYFLESPEGQDFIVHIVPVENNNGIEELALKVFREDEDGPTLMEERRFPGKKELEKALSQELRQGRLKSRQTVDTLQLGAGLEVRRSRENGEVRELLWRNSQGKLDCKVTDNLLSCECK